ncbi:MAG TPA: tRNA epoxyqueuosine(34) reductase QueG [Firmicutes bacterium]|nr:tRNA epoxyqueuosine(34) reductase QueG [Bacillota bacterium]
MNVIQEQLKQKIIAYAQDIGINKIGFTHVEPFIELEQELKKRETLNYSSGLTKGSIEEKVNPKLIMQNAQSIISIALAYPRISSMQKISNHESPHVQFARSSWGKDYHLIMEDKLAKLKSFLESEVEGIEVLTMVDTGKLDDRAVALRAGIGFSGKNSNVIAESFGSYIYLGELLISVALPPDSPIESLCGSCDRCIKACPSQAILPNGGFNERRCLSYVTQSKDIEDETLLKKVNKYVYGCDICQEVCPFNREIDSHFHEEMECSGVEFPSIAELLPLTQKEFKAQFGHLAGSWRGVSVIKRNAILNARFLKYKGAIPAITTILDQDGPHWLKKAAQIALDDLNKLDS